MKKINWNNIGWIALKVGAYIILNAALIFFMIAQMVEVTTTTGDSASYWDTMTVKYVAKEIYGKVYKDHYHFWIKPLVYSLIAFGLYMSLMFSKMLYNSAKDKKHMEIQEQQTERIVSAINSNKSISPLKTNRKEKKNTKDVIKYL